MKFLDEKIDCYNKNDIEMLSLEEKSEYLESYPYFDSRYYCKLDGKIYHKKFVDIEVLINELIGKLVSEYFNDKHIFSKVIKLNNGSIFLLTDNFIDLRYKYNFFDSNLFYKIIFDKNDCLNLENLDNVDEFVFNERIIKMDKITLKKLKYKLKMMIVNDFIRNQSDRWYHNIMFKLDGNNCSMLPLFDFEYSFYLNDPMLLNIFNFNIEDKNIIRYIRNDDDFQELFDMVLKLDFNSIIEKMFLEYPVIMCKNSINNYKNIIESKKNDIKYYKLLK